MAVKYSVFKVLNISLVDFRIAGLNDEEMRLLIGSLRDPVRGSRLWVQDSSPYTIQIRIPDYTQEATEDIISSVIHTLCCCLVNKKLELPFGYAKHQYTNLYYCYL